jgi:mannitol/fructose-specific phosphotransferase system IIA component (Ntr-type)
MGMETLIISMVLIFSGLTFYWFYGRIKTSREYALLHLIDRVMNKKLTGGYLETELSEIIRQRDDLCSDPFEEVVNRALIIDLKSPVKRDDFWEMLIDRLAEKFNLQKSTIKKGFEDRELGPASEIMPGIAVSDLVVPGDGMFDLIALRCVKGLDLFSSKDPVTTFFVILTSRDKRDSYLHTLAILAQIAGDFKFEHNWKKAKGEERLRDILLLTERKRICSIPASF